MLYEAAAYFSTFLICYAVFLRERERRPGKIFGVFLILIFTSRFFIEFVKELQVTKESGWAFDFGQMLSVPFVLVGTAMVVRAYVRPAERIIPVFDPKAAGEVIRTALSRAKSSAKAKRSNK